jgi:hypothetical protein
MSAFVLVASPSFAQTAPAPTPAGAKAFMTATIDRGNVTMNTVWPPSDRIPDLPLLGSYPATDLCVVGIRFIRAPTSTEARADLNFRVIENVSRSGARVTLIHGEFKVRLTFAAEDTATRFAFAADFLRVHCDPNKGTGF